jgi:predicted extracellular nuclease
VLAAAGSLLILAGLLPVAAAPVALADSTPQALPLSQAWSNTGLITISDDWAGVPGVVGYRGDNLVAATAVDPQTVVADGSSTPVDVNADQTAPNTFTTGGVSEFELADSVVALQGSGTADAPHLVIALNTTGASGVAVSYNVRDIDGSADNAVQPVALQYRVGGTGNYTNVAAAFIADATEAGAATLVTPVAVTLPAAAANQALLEIRIITTDAVGSDEWVGIDDISITGATTASDPIINEFVANHTGTDTNEYVEVLGDPATSYAGYSVLHLEGDSTGAGVVDTVFSVGSTNADGLWVTGFLNNALENGSITLVLVEGFTGAVGNDLDTNNDGVFDVTPWTRVVDDVAVNDGTAGDALYSSTVLSAGFGGSAFVPGGASRIPNGTDTDSVDDWRPNDFDGDGLPQFPGTPQTGEALNTPGAPNELVTVPPPDLVINEVDYDQPSTDTAEFLEIKNVGATTVDLTGVSVELVNGASGVAVVYSIVDLIGTLGPGDYFVVCANDLTTSDCDLDYIPDTNFIQNGAPDAIGLRFSGALIDAVSYEGDTVASYTEGSGTGLVDDGVGTTSISRCPDGNDTDQNNADFDLRPSTPGLENDCPTGLSITDVSANEGDSGTTSFDFTVSLSEPAPAGGVTFDIATADGTATTADNDYVAKSLVGQTILEGATSYTFTVLVNGDIANEPNETFFVDVTNVVGAVASDAQGLGTIANDDLPITFVHDIQGSGSAITGNGPFAIEGIVVGDFQTQGTGQLRGFFVQEEDADADANPATSEGIFVFCSACPVAVAVGDKVRVTGSASEFFDMSQLTASTATSVLVLSAGNPLPTAAPVELPVPGVPSGDLAAATAAINAYFEPFEGMLVSYPDTLSVAEYFELARYGQVILSEGGRPHQFTATNTPSAAGLVDHEIELATRTVILDDGDNRENRPVATDPNTAYPYPEPGLSTTNRFRGGDTITNLTGVLHWSFAGGSSPNAWRVRPVSEAFDYTFAPTNPRPAAPDVDGRLKVASFNVLNYFLTIDTTSSNNVGTCGPSGTMDCRGADSAAELARQREKLLKALSAIDADVFGFMEMENSPGVEPLADIVAGLPGYDYIDTGVIGTDAIRVGIIYRTSTVEPAGDYAILDSTVDPRFNDDLNRPALAQTFEEIDTGARFTVVVNHLKSKGSDCNDVGDPDTGDGQGNCAVTRTLAAQAMADWLATDPTGSGDRDVLIIGDLNSYAKEDPIAALQDAGYTDLVADFGGAGAYGYVFDGQLGYLDHALANPTLEPQVAGVAEWHINADEIPLFDYNDDVRDTGEASFEEESAVHPLYEANEFRTSDHDPVIIGLDLLDYDFAGFREPVGPAPATLTANAGSVVPVKFSLGGDLGLSVLFESPQVYLCASYPFGSTETAASADGVGLTYDSAKDLYQFDWKTRKPWANSCRTFEVTFDDGSYRTIDVDFVK